ncbi:MAG: hypothetical protein ACXWL2_04325 [Candidatus Chromulinivorax sp.]
MKKEYGALRKFMLIILLSILGSYCISNDQQLHEQNFLSTGYQLVVSSIDIVKKMIINSYDYVYNLFFEHEKQDVAIQYHTGDITSYVDYCTDAKEDCQQNQIFFDDTWNYTGAHNIDDIDLPIDPKKIL